MLLPQLRPCAPRHGTIIPQASSPQKMQPKGVIVVIVVGGAASEQVCEFEVEVEVEADSSTDTDRFESASAPATI